MSTLPSTAPSGLTWIPDAFAPDACADHLAGLIREVPWEDHTFTIFGRTVPMPRRIQMFGPHGYEYSGVAHPPRPLTPRLETIRTRVEAATGRRFNSVLVNLYRDGADSMGWHTDDDYSHGGQSMVASVSFGAERTFRFRPRRKADRAGQPSFGWVLTDGSILGIDGAARTDWQHALPRTRRVLGARVNLTWRHMLGS